jgi:hypothetical protein
MSATPLFIVGHLSGKYRAKLLGRHPGPCQYALLLHSGGGGHHNNNISYTIETGLEQKRHIEHAHGMSARFRPSEKGLPVVSDERMDNSFKSLESLAVSQNHLCER